MGTIQHNAVIATTWNKSAFESVANWIKNRDDAGHFIAGTEKINGFTTIVVLPDGSKEGWDDSRKGDQRRSEFISFLKQFNYEDGSNPWDWIDVSFGELGSHIALTNCQNEYDVETPQ